MTLFIQYYVECIILLVTITSTTTSLLFQSPTTIGFLQILQPTHAFQSESLSSIRSSIPTVSSSTVSSSLFSVSSSSGGCSRVTTRPITITTTLVPTRNHRQFSITNNNDDGTTPSSTSNRNYALAARSTRIRMEETESSSSSSTTIQLVQPPPKTIMAKSSSGLELPYESALEVLRVYHSLHGDLAIPRRYLVPTTKDFPTPWHSIDLSATVYNMNWWSKHVKSKPDRVYQLNQFGFIWERLQPEWNLVLEALVTFKQEYGHVRVPPSFIVPKDGGGVAGGPRKGDSSSGGSKTVVPWPIATWGIKLGSCVYRIRARGDFLRDVYTCGSRRNQLDGLGFIWDVGEHRYNKFYTALHIFARHQFHRRRELRRRGSPPPPEDGGSGGGRRGGGEGEYHRRSSNRVLRIPHNFKIPSGPTLPPHTSSSPRIPNPWPPELYDYPLGVKCGAIRQKGLYIKKYPERRRELEELGLQCSSGGGNAALGWLEVVHAAAIYSRVNGRKLDVPMGFVVPAPDRERLGDGGSWPWPEQLWGLPLGQRLKDVRLKGAYLTNPKSCDSRRAQLDAMGFVWKPKRGRRKRSPIDGEGGG